MSESNGNGSKDHLGVLDVGFVWFVWMDECRPNGIMYQQLNPCTAPPTAAEAELHLTVDNCLSKKKPSKHNNIMI